MLWFDSTIVLLLPAIALAMWAQYKVKSAYARYSQVGTRAGLTGADAAARVLRDAGMTVARGDRGSANDRSCAIETVAGEMTDHYDPRTRTLRLSQDVYHGRSVAAIGIAAHEVGHAIQHANSYAPLALRSVMYPVSSLGSTLAFPLFFIGLLFPSGASQLLMMGGILLFAGAVAFTLVTLPVEFNASNRAIKALAHGGYLTEDELAGARRVLSAAALTYVAAAAMAVMNLLRMLLIARGRD